MFRLDYSVCYVYDGVEDWNDYTIYKASIQELNIEKVVLRTQHKDGLLIFDNITEV